MQQLARVATQLAVTITVLGIYSFWSKQVETGRNASKLLETPVPDFRCNSCVGSVFRMKQPKTNPKPGFRVSWCCRSLPGMRE
jgi:hypothetical protein